MKILLTLFALTSSLPGQFLVPSWRSDTGSSHAEWDDFSVARFGLNFPDVVEDENATLTSSTSSAFLTSSRNIYSFQGPLALQLDDETDLQVRNILLQVRTLGSGLDREGAVLVYEDDDGETKAVPVTRTFVTSEEELTGERGGIGTNYVLQWDLREAPVSGNYTLLFRASSTSLSLDQVSLDLSESYQEVEKPQPFQLSISGSEVVVRWIGIRQLQESASLAGPWTDVPGSLEVNELRFPVEQGAKFFRLKQPTIIE